MFQVSISVDKRDTRLGSSSGKATARFGTHTTPYTFSTLNGKLVIKQAGHEVSMTDRKSNLYCDVVAQVSRLYALVVRAEADKKRAKLSEDFNNEANLLDREAADFE